MTVRTLKKRILGDILGLHNHGTIQIGDTFTRGEMMKFTGIPNFAPELFRRIRLKDPLKQNSYSKGWYSFPKRARCRCSVRSPTTI